MSKIKYIVHNCPSVNFEDREVILTGQKANDTIRAVKQLTGWVSIQVGVFIKKLGITILEVEIEFEE